MKGLVVAANRLPVEVGADGQLNTSPGGLASALSSVTAAGTHWVGWAGPEAVRAKPFEHGDLRLYPVPLSADEVERYYQGFSNAILWPLFHGRLRRVELNRAWWHSYRIVNRRFAAAICRTAPVGGTVWVHDYHLLLVPALIRAKRPDLRIGLFLHIPFPNAQLFSMLPWRKEVIRGMLGADVLGFQVPEDVCQLRCRGRTSASTREVADTSCSTASTRSTSMRSRSRSTSPTGTRWVTMRRPQASRHREEPRCRVDLPGHRPARLHEGHLAAPSGVRRAARQGLLDPKTLHVRAGGGAQPHRTSRPTRTNARRSRR